MKRFLWTEEITLHEVVAVKIYIKLAVRKEYSINSSFPVFMYHINSLVSKAKNL